MDNMIKSPVLTNEGVVVFQEKTVPRVLGLTDLELYFGPMYAFDDGDPDYLPMHLATDKDIRDGEIVEGWFGRWRLGSEVGEWTGPFEREDLVQVAIVDRMIHEMEGN